MDVKDLAILRLLQKNATLSMNEIADLCALSKTAVWRRVQELERQGIIRQRITTLNAPAVGFGLSVFTSIKTSQHSDDWFDKFSKTVKAIPNVLELHRVSGDIDYLLRIVAKDMNDYDRVYRHLIKHVDCADVSSTFVMESIKATTELPL